MSLADLTEKDLLADEKKVFGRIILTGSGEGRKTPVFRPGM
jgi:hypothetical protein